MRTSTSINNEVKLRPYWHVDAKWITGLILCVVLGCFLWVNTLAQLTARDVAVPVMTAVIALQFSPEGLDAADDFAQIKDEWLPKNEAEFRPIEGLPLVLSREQVEQLSPRELRLALFQQLAEPLYDQGVDGFAKTLTADPQQQKKFANDAALLGAISHQTHATLSLVRWVLLGLVLLFTIPVVYFSAGLGRLITPGVILLFTSWLGAVVFTLATITANSSGQRFGEPSRANMVGMIGQEVVKYVPGVFNGWIAAFGLGVGLLITAGVWGLVRRLRREQTQAN